MSRTWIAKALSALGSCLFWPAAALVCWFELRRTPPLLEALYWDKGLHFLAYFGLSGMISVALKADRRARAATFLVAFLGAALEILQGVVGRDCSIADELANALGALAGAGTGWLLLWALGAKTLAPRVDS